MEMIHAVESKPVVVKGVIQQVNECKRLIASIAIQRSLLLVFWGFCNDMNDDVRNGLPFDHMNSSGFALARCGSQIVEGHSGRKPLHIVEAREIGVYLAP